MSDEPARHLGRVQHAGLLGGDLAGAEPRHGAHAGLAADGFGSLQLARVARRAVPVVALHVVARLRQQHAAHAVAGGRIAREEAVRIAVDTHSAVAPDSGALGVGDARVDGAAGRLADPRALHRLLGRYLPGMIQVEIRYVARQLLGIREPGAVVLGRVPRDVAGLLDGLGHRARRQVRGTRRTLALAEVDGDAHAAIALVLDGLDLAETHRRRESLLQADVGLGLCCTHLPGMRQ